jgi:putative transposase
MKKSKYTYEQIAFALKRAETGTPVTEVIRRTETFPSNVLSLEDGIRRTWRQELRRLKQLEEENRKLNQLVADLILDKHILKDVLAKSSDAWTTARDRRALRPRTTLTIFQIDGGRRMRRLTFKCPLCAPLRTSYQ